MPISHNHNAIFIHIPKTGGQSVSAMLGINKGSQKEYYYEGLTHLSIELLEKRIDLTDKFIFTFVRNPYDKIVSEFHWRMRNRSSVVFNEPTKERLKFPEYMEVLLERFPLIVDVKYRSKAHVLPQHTFIDDRVEVFRFEQFESECEKINERLGIKKDIPHVNQGPHTAEHTKRTIEIVNRLYEKDFEVFKYEML